MTRTRRAIGIAAVLAATVAVSAALAQTTPADPLAPGAGANSDAPEPAAPKVKAKPRRSEGGLLTVAVHNGRSVGLVELRVGPAGAPELTKVVGPLAFGRKTTAHLKRVKDCLYDIHAQFADEADTDQKGVDLCADKNINLTD